LPLDLDSSVFSRMRRVAKLLPLVVTLTLAVSALAQNVTDYTSNIWLREQIDPFTDENRSWVAVGGSYSPDSLSGDTPIVAGFRCFDSRWDVLFWSQYDYYGSDDRVRVQWRFDDAEPSSNWWTLTQSGDGVFVPANYQQNFVNTAIGSSQLALAIYDYDDQRNVLLFQPGRAIRSPR
jgi:hypothetical protein